MATSGSYDYSVTAATIIQGALEDINVLEAGESVDTDDQTVALRVLNLIAKQWQGDADMAPGLKVWSRQRVHLFLGVDQVKYLIGPGSSDARATTSYGRTTISASEAAGQTTISITSNTDTTTNPGTTVTMTASDIVGIVQDDGTMHWSTISGTPAATMTIADALASAASAGNYVYWFTSRAQRFPVIESARLRNSDLIDTPLGIFREAVEYDQLPQKNAEGDPINILVEPLITQTRVTCDFAPQDVTKQIVMTVLYPAEDYDSTANDIAFPQEYYLALEWELAFRLAPKFNKPWTPAMQQNYSVALGKALGLNPTKSVKYFQPNADGHA